MQLKQMKLIVAVVSALVALSCGAVQAAPSYTITDLGGNSHATGINDSGQVVGSVFATYSNSRHAFLYSGGSITDIGTLNGGYNIAGHDIGASSYAFGINNSGQIVGQSQTASRSPSHAFLYSGGRMTDLGAGADSHASSINANGQVVGYGKVPYSAFYHAFLYSGGSKTDLGTLSGGDGSLAFSINDSGQVVGDASTAAGTYHAFMYNDGVMTDIGTLGGRYSRATGINNSGQIVGWAHPVDSSFEHAFLYSDGSMIDLGTLGGIRSIAKDINDSGQVVGSSLLIDNADKNQHAFLYMDGVMTDLNSLIDPLSGWTIYEANAINNLGQIAANGCTPGICRALLLTPVPEPETYLMMLAGLGLLGVMVRRRNKMRK